MPRFYFIQKEPKVQSRLKLYFAQLFNQMTDFLPLDNLYESLYRSAQLPIGKTTSKREAEEVVRHLGYIYNAFGIIVKDLVKIVGCKFQQQSMKKSSQTEPRGKARKDCFEKPNEEQEKIKELTNNITSSQHYGKNGKNSNEHRYLLVHNKESNKMLPSKYANKQDGSFQIEQLSEKQHDESIGKCNRTVKVKEPVQDRNEINQSRLFPSTFKQNLFQKISPLFSNCPTNQPNINLFAAPNQQIIAQPSKEQSFIIIQSQKQRDDVSFNIEDEMGVEKPRSERSHQMNDEVIVNIYENRTEEGLRMIPGRKKKERQNFKGITCPDCDKYYKMMQLQCESMCNCTSRHRSNLPMRAFPKNHFTQQFDID